MSSNDKRTAWVLAGGGSFGAVQVGMLRALVAHGAVPDMVVGSSVGAINGAYFAATPNMEGVDRLTALWRGVRRDQVFPVTWRNVAGLFSRRGYLVDAAGLRHIFEQHLPYRELEQAAVPLHLVATDLFGGVSVRLSSGPAVDALLASCAIPAILPPVSIAGRLLIDGAVSDNTPVSVALELGAERVIVLPTGFACSLEQPPRGAIGSALHAITLLVAHQLVMELERCRDRAEIITVPPLCPLSSSPYDFSQAGSLIERAAEQTQHWIERGGLNRQRVPGALRAHLH
jgi:NTE family protein